MAMALRKLQCLYGHTPSLAEEGGRAQTKKNILVRLTLNLFPFLYFSTSQFTIHKQQYIAIKSIKRYKLLPFLFVS